MLGLIHGSQRRTIILLSHFDTKSGISDTFAGANDSGSSTGLLLEMARVLKQGPVPPVDLVLAFLDGEECRVAYGPHDGLHGSRYLARTLVQNRCDRRVRAVILADMVGDRDLDVGIPRNSSPALVSLVFAAAHEEQARSMFSLSSGSVLDDHVPFLDAGMPAIDLIDFTYGSSGGGNDYWHTDADTLDKISADSLAVVGRVIVRVVNRVMASE